MAETADLLGRSRRRGGLILITLAAWLLAQGPAAAEPVGWRVLEPGLALADIPSPVKSQIGDSVITVVRIDPKHFAFKLIAAKQFDREIKTASAWAREHKLLVAVNAGMFLRDGLTSVGYMRNFGHVNNPRLNKKYNAIMAFNRMGGAPGVQVPEVQVIDRRCQDFGSLRREYNTLIQSIRMIDCRRRNVWSKQPRRWSMVITAMDGAGRVLFVFTRSPYSVHDFINILLGLPLDIRNAMYLEGGPEATLYLSAGGVSFEKVGSYETDFNEDDKNKKAWRIPNVVGVVRRKQ